MKPPKSILDAIHETASDLFRLGFIDKLSNDNYDALCVPSSPLPIGMVENPQKIEFKNSELSPLNEPTIIAKISTKEIVDIIREGRER